MPFMLLPFRPTSDTSASRNFIRNFFKADYEGTGAYSGEQLAQELRLMAPLVRMPPIRAHHHVLTPTPTDALQYHQMVLEQASRRRGDLGRIRTFSNWRVRYVNCWSIPLCPLAAC